jgi:hypothetical protein
VAARPVGLLAGTVSMALFTSNGKNKAGNSKTSKISLDRRTVCHIPHFCPPTTLFEELLCADRGKILLKNTLVTLKKVGHILQLWN